MIRRCSPGSSNIDDSLLVCDSRGGLRLWSGAADFKSFISDFL